MHLEVIRLVRAALEHEDDGVNAQLAILPRDAEDAELPQVVRVIDPTRDDEALVEPAGFPGPSIASWPVLVVDIVQPATWQGQVRTVHRDTLDTLAVSVFYVTASADTAARVRETLYTLRAVARALERWLRLDNNDPRRVRNGIVVDAALAMTVDRVEVELENGFVTGVLSVDLALEDTLP